mgnify:CR=1 FL=1
MEVRTITKQPKMGYTGEAMTNTPDRIFLNFGPHPGDDFKDHSEVTWCTDKINESDVEYVRAESTTDEITFLEGLKIWLPTHKITDVENRIKQLKPPPPETIGEAE